MGWVGLGQSADGLGWIGSHKVDPGTTLSGGRRGGGNYSEAQQARAGDKRHSYSASGEASRGIASAKR